MASRMPTLIKIARLTYGKILSAHGKIRLNNECGADLKDGGPYLILSNHVGVLDPIMISAVMPRHIRWVAGAYLFKTRFLHKVIGDWCTAIPKQQGRSDVSMVRSVQRALKNGDNVGLFPEGTRTWDGEMMPVNYSPMAKLLKLYRQKVLFIHIEGGFAHQPRWADFKRQGSVVINVKYQLTPEQIADMDIILLQDTIKKYLHFSNDEWKQTVRYSFRSPKRAEGLQRLLYMCPKCNAVDTLKTGGNRIVCSKCNTITVLDDSDNLTSLDTPFTRLSQWHSWEASEIGNRAVLEPEPGVLFQKGDADNEGGLETISKKITVQLKDDVIIVTCKGVRGRQYQLPLNQVSSLILNAKQTIELFLGDILYRIRLLPGASSLKYHEYYISYVNRKSRKDIV